MQRQNRSDPANRSTLDGAVMVIRLLGALEVEFDRESVELPPGKPRSLLALLALRRGPHPRRELAGRLWPDVLDSSARASLRSALWALRTSLGPAASGLIATRQQVGLAPQVTTDLEEFRRLVEAGELERALALCRGRLLSDFDDEWVLEAREEHERDLGALLTELARAAQASGDQTAAVDWTRRRLAVDPLSEDATRELMRALAGAGDRAAALAAYDSLRGRLREQLGIAPSEATRTLARGLARGEDGSPRRSAARAFADDSPSRAADALPFAGRADELRALVTQWRAAKQGQGCVALITGEAGIGKTRLAAKLIETAGGGDAIVASCAALDLGGGAPFGLWAELLAELVQTCGTPPDLPGMADLALLSPELEGAFAPERPTVSPRAPELERVRLFEATVGLLVWAARRGPCILLFEDVHAADPASLELVGYVARRLPRLPVLIVLTRRDLPRRAEVDAVLRRLPPRGITVREVELGPMPPGDMGRLVRATAELDAARIDEVVAAAEGNPLLAIEVARALAAGLEQPAESLRAVVRAAAAPLSREARHLAEAVAVAGREVHPAEAERLAIGEPHAAAAEAIDAGLLISTSGSLGFRHALLREAVYADLAEPRRARLHASFATVLAAEGSSRQAAEAARHLLLAGREQDAIEQLARAAQHARSVAAYREAAEFLEAALRISPDSAELLEELAEVEAWRGRRDEALAAFERAASALARADSATQAAAWIRRGRWLRGALCYPDESRLAYTRALELLDAAGDPGLDVRVEAVAGLAWAEAVAGDIERAEELLDRLDGQPAGDEAVELDREVARGHALIRRGRFTETYEPLSQAAMLAARVGRPDMAYSCLINASTAAACAADFERSLAFADRCREAMHDAGLASLEANALAGRSHILTRLGRLQDAQASAAAEAELADQLDDPKLAAMADHDRGMTCHAAGDHDGAAELLAAALERDPPVSRALARLTRAESLVALGRLGEAEEELRATALEPLDSGDFPDTLVARLSRVQGLIAVARGDRALAAKRLEESARTWRRRAGAYRLGDRYMAVMVDLGRPPVLGLVEPRRELERVEAELASLREPAPTR